MIRVFSIPTIANINFRDGAGPTIKLKSIECRSVRALERRERESFNFSTNFYFYFTSLLSNSLLILMLQRYLVKKCDDRMFTNHDLPMLCYLRPLFLFRIKKP